MKRHVTPSEKLSFSCPADGRTTLILEFVPFTKLCQALRWKHQGVPTEILWAFNNAPINHPHHCIWFCLPLGCKKIIWNKCSTSLIDLIFPTTSCHLYVDPTQTYSDNIFISKIVFLDLKTQWKTAVVLCLFNGSLLHDACDRSWVFWIYGSI